MVPMKSYRPWHPDQSFLFPPSPREWLPEDHLAYFVLDLVAGLDLSQIEGAIHAKDARGTRPYDPRMMTALILYGYSVGVVSSRRIERATHEDVGFRVLAGDQHPDHTAISAFRKRHIEALGSLFVQVLRLCQKAGLVKLGHVALDGTKIKANASKRKAMSYKRILKKEKALIAEVEAMLREAVPDIELGSDWIVGFPGESEADFQGTLEFLREVQPVQNYVFQYSPRPETRAHDLEDDVPLTTKKARNRELLAAAEQVALKRHQGRLGQVLDVFVESALQDGVHVRGRSRNNLSVTFPGLEGLIGSTRRVLIESASSFGLWGAGETEAD